MSERDSIKMHALWRSRLDEFVGDLAEYLTNPDLLKATVDNAHPRGHGQRADSYTTAHVREGAVRHVVLRHVSGHFETFLLDPRVKVTEIAPEVLYSFEGADLPKYALTRRREGPASFLRQHFPQVTSFGAMPFTNLVLEAEYEHGSLRVKTIRASNANLPRGTILAIKTEPGQMVPGTETLPRHRGDPSSAPLPPTGSPPGKTQVPAAPSDEPQKRGGHT